MELRIGLVQEFSLELPSTVAFDHPTASALAAFIAAALAEQGLESAANGATVLGRRTSVASLQSELSSWDADFDNSAAAGGVAVVGISGRWPGSQPEAGVDGFWEAWCTQKDLPQVPFLNMSAAVTARFEHFWCT